MPPGLLVAKPQTTAQEPTVPSIELPSELPNEYSGKQISSQSSTVHGGKREAGHDQVIYIEFEEGDRRNPANFSRTKKWIVTAIACLGTIQTATVAGSYAMGQSSMVRDLNCTNLQATAGFSVYPLGFALLPLVTTSLSEEFGRKPLYVVSGLVFLLMFVMIGLAKNIYAVILGRLIQGMAGSSGSTMVGGTIADIWSPKERGTPMAVFTFTAMAGTGLGPLIGAWIEMNSRLQWRWIQWVQMISFALFLVLVFFMDETRSGVLLTRLAKQRRKETGDKRYRARIEDERESLLTLIVITCTRPLYLLFTEPIVAAFSLWIGFSWGVLYGFIAIIPLVFQTVHHFSIGMAGTTFVSMIIGSILGFLTNFKQQSLYLKNYPTRGPEARLYAACVAGIMLPASMFIYAWTTLPQVHWIALNIAIVLLMWSSYIIYQTVFSYLSDCYGTWASSASAGQSLTRNIIATIFPLFITQMFEKLTYKWACTLFACIAMCMIPIPFVLFFWGPVIRKRSKVASRLIEV